MSEETDTKWLCHRCVKKEGATVDADPVLLRVCDGCQVENYTRLSRGAVGAVKRWAKSAMYNEVARSY